jgi:GNAT superfamily N-acetyltransferase
MVTVRSMVAGDEVHAEEVWDLAYRTLIEARGGPVPERTPELVDRIRDRMRYLRSTDPGGSWVAVEDDLIVGVAQAHVRGGTWVLATLGVAPAHQEAGVGRQLLEAALGDGTVRNLPGAIFSSPDPRALARYASAGFALHPVAEAWGRRRRPVEDPADVLGGGLSDLDHVDAVDSDVRGSTRRGDVAYLLGRGYRLVVADDGYAVHVADRGIVSLLAARDEGTAAALLSAVLARTAPDADVGVGWLTSAHQWAIEVLVAAGVPIMVEGALMTRGRWLPDLPYIPSGIFG